MLKHLTKISVLAFKEIEKQKYIYIFMHAYLDLITNFLSPL